jgi:hypothetical protein
MNNTTKYPLSSPLTFLFGIIPEQKNRKEPTDHRGKMYQGVRKSTCAGNCLVRRTRNLALSYLIHLPVTTY